jgi:hypothetical protein
MTTATANSERENIMTITIDVSSPQAQTWLQTEAVRSGIDIPQYVERLLEATAASRATDLEPGSPAWLVELRTVPVNVPAVSLEALSRDSLYSEDED